jgi:hypothetical protein
VEIPLVDFSQGEAARTSTCPWLIEELMLSENEEKENVARRKNWRLKAPCGISSIALSQLMDPMHIVEQVPHLPLSFKLGQML